MLQYLSPAVVAGLEIVPGYPLVTTQTDPQTGLVRGVRLIRRNAPESVAIELEAWRQDTQGQNHLGPVMILDLSRDGAILTHGDDKRILDENGLRAVFDFLARVILSLRQRQMPDLALVLS